MGILLVFLICAGWAIWVMTNPKVRINLYRSCFHLSEERARNQVNRPLCLAALKAVRVVGILFLLSIAVLEGVHRSDLGVWFLVGSVVGVCLLTVCLVRR